MVLTEAFVYNQRAPDCLREDHFVDRVAVMNWLILHNNYQSYLEIGCRDNACFSRIEAQHKVGVDPQQGGTHTMTSDVFFEKHADMMFDLVFVDGLHEMTQVLRDVNHALKQLNEGGVIVLHDCRPLTAKGATYPPLPTETFQNGNVFLALWHLRLREDLDVRVLNVDWGLGIVQKKANTSLEEVERVPVMFVDANDERFEEYADNVKAIAGLGSWTELLPWLPSRALPRDEAPPQTTPIMENGPKPTEPEWGLLSEEKEKEVICTSQPAPPKDQPPLPPPPEGTPHIAALIMVKDEEKNIMHTLRSIVGFCDSVIVYDTGSLDRTMEIIETFCEEHKLPYHLKEGEFVDYAASRNVSLDFADTIDGPDYYLMLDSNDELKGGTELLADAKKYWASSYTGFKCKQQTEYKLEGKNHGKICEWDTVRFLKARVKLWRYEGRVHEAFPLQPNSYTWLHPAVKIYQDRRRDLAKTQPRYRRDRKWLEEDYMKDKGNPRLLFYLAQTYESLKLHDLSVKAYFRRGQMTTGFYEERYVAWMRAASISNIYLHNWGQALAYYMNAWEVWKRPEPMIEIAKHYRDKQDWITAFMFIKQACRTPAPKNAQLFQDPSQSRYLRWHLMGLIGFWAREFDDGMLGCIRAIDEGDYRKRDEENLQCYLRVLKQQ